MAAQVPALQRLQQTSVPQAQSQHSTPPRAQGIEQSQEWVLFSPQSQADTSTQQTQTAGLSRASELGSLQTGAQSGEPHSSVLDDDDDDDPALDELDDNLNAFREPLYSVSNHQTNGPLLPVHDGLGSFQASSGQVLARLWQHEQFNSKRKREGQGHHRSASSIFRQLETIEELEAQANEEKRLRVEKWRLEHSQAMLEESEREQQRLSRITMLRDSSKQKESDLLFGTTPKQSDYLPNSSTSTEEPAFENEPFWRRITRKFIRDVIGIDEPLLSVILGESLPGEDLEGFATPTPDKQAQHEQDHEDSATWRDKLLQRIANELGVFVHQITPQPEPLRTYTADYAGMAVTVTESRSAKTFARSVLPDEVHAESWGLEDNITVTNDPDSSMDLKKEREYWEKELDVKAVFRYLKDRIIGPSASTPQSRSVDPQPFVKDDSARRTAIIRQHHPLVNKSYARSPVRSRRDNTRGINLSRRQGSSCASESAKSVSLRASALRSGSSRNYWDIGGSAGSGSLIASGGMLGGWGYV